MRYIDSTATIEMVGPRQRVGLNNVELRNSDLTIENRPTQARSGGVSESGLDIIIIVDVGSLTVGSGSRFTQVVDGTDEADTVLIGADLDVDGEYTLQVDTGDGPDRFFGVFDLAGSTGFASIRVSTGADDDRAVLGVFGVEGLQRLFALLDAGPGADRVLASPEVTVLNSGDLVERPGRDDDADGFVDFLNLRLTNVPPPVTAFNRLEAAALASDLFLEYHEITGALVKIN